MAAQNESNPKSGDVQSEDKTQHSDNGATRGVSLESANKQPAPFSEFDPFRSQRITETRSETATFLAQFSLQPTGFENANESELLRLSEDAAERAQWSEAQSDAFSGVLRLAIPTPRRSNRIL